MNRIRIFLSLCMLGFTGPWLQAQNARCSGPGSDSDSIYTGAIFANYGSVTNAVNNKYSTSGSLGQIFIGQYLGQEYQGTAGFYSSFLLPPLPPILTATQGDLLDRIQLNWAIDPLSPATSEGFNIYRDGIFLANVGRSIRTYNDFNVIAGRPYNYTVRGVNTFGEGFAGNALGFQVPNGVVTGWVQTPSGSPVPNALITLTPMQGFSARFGPADGAIADATGSGLLPAPDEPWTLCFWIKTAQAADTAGILQLQVAEALDIRPLAGTGGQEGVAIAVGGTPLFSGAFPDSTKNDWHHMALTFDGAQYRLYIDGVLTALAPAAALSNASALALGAQTGHPGWEGYLDELRIYHRLLDELDFGEVMGGTASSLTPGLQFYWKMDEEQGTKSFDLIRRNQLYFCGAGFDAERPPVRIAGVTNEEGYYRIESASYGTGTTFLAHPSKYFYKHRALKFVRAENDYAELPDFALPDKATIELWVNSAGPDGEQCLLSKRWGNSSFALFLQPKGTDNKIIVNFNGNLDSFGLLGMGYQHLAIGLESDGSNHTVSVFRNGVQQGGSYSFSGPGNFSDTTYQWIVGARGTPGGLTDHFGGLIAELAVYDSILPPALLLEHAQADRDPQARGLQVYFPFDEGNGTRLNNIGALLTGPGQAVGTEWTPFAPNQSVTPHVFTPGSRQVTLNPSVTSVDQVDFTDRSTVPVAGYVRYKNTDCFAPNVEILVNGASFNPAVFTDATGRFVIDFDPGATATLMPKFADHQFIPAFWEVTNVVTPIAGIVFNDVTTRTVSGVVAGGLCKKSVISGKPCQGPQDTSQCTNVIVKVRSADGCLERQITIDNVEGEYEFLDLPPLEELTVAVVEHSNDIIKNFFQVAGGTTVDISEKDTIVDFIYFAPPEVVLLSGLDPFSPTCETIVLDQGEYVALEIKFAEPYEPILDTDNSILDDGVCYLDTASFRIINGFADEVVDTTMSGGLLKYKFRVGSPNPSPPYLKTLQIIGTSLDDREGSLTKQAVVTGIRNKENTFTTQLPEVPILVLRDPPGDGSYAYWEKNNKVCQTLGTELEFTDGYGNVTTFDNAPDVKIVTSAFGGPIIETETKIGGEVAGALSFRNQIEGSFEVCLSAAERISTSADDLIVGPDADVYVGLGTNVSVGLADEVTFDPDSCKAGVKELIAVEPLSATTFLYSQFHIQNNVIRYLDAIIQNDDLQMDSTELAGYVQSRDLWAGFLQDNAALKTSARFIRNLSFDAGATYESSISSEETDAESLNLYIDSDGYRRAFAGGSWNSLGVQTELKFTYSISTGFVSSDNTFEGITVGYVLSDDDPGDAFTVDVAMDTAYNTPVFKTVAGQSSCPWEAGTANREAPNLELAQGSQYEAVNVPAHEPAVFHLNLGNLSASNEDWTYGLSAIAANNPHGAIIRLNGAPLNSTQKFIIPYGTSIPITLTVERGPVEYDYDSLLVVLYSECEFERDNTLALQHNPMFFSPIYLGAHFIRPCSEVDINVPEQNWVVINNDPNQPGTIRRITVSGYDLNSTDFQLVRVQYRRSDGDGAWINIPDVYERYNPNWSQFADLPDPKPPVLDTGFTQFLWETAGLSDGPYEIHAWAVCTGGATDKPGFSEIIKGRIDREAPSLVGVPEPSDGVYNVGDEISFTFNQHVNCNKLNPLDDVLLFDATTDQPIDIAISCYENKIVLNPVAFNSAFENHILRAELHNIEDLVGNAGAYYKWEFYVDRNELAWLTDSAGMTKYEDETKRVTASIQNRGGYPVPFEITYTPEWVRVIPNKGTMVPNEIRTITFEVDSSLAFGLWHDTIVLVTAPGQNPNFFMGGDESLPFGVRVICRPPEWDIDAGLYENTMNLVLKLNIQGEYSADPEDIVVAYIGDELRGRAYVTYSPEIADYLVYLTVYGNPDDVGELLRLEIWDASACLRYGEVLESFTFQPDVVIGFPTNPQVVHTNDLILREIPLGYGWNWVSFNLEFPDNSLDAALASLQYPANDLIRAQGPFAVYSNGHWVGSLAELADTTMYIYKTDQPDTIRMLGKLIDPLTASIHLKPGWNWIGYIPNYALPVDDALASLTAKPNDLIKSQVAFAIYVDDAYRWVGNLKFLQPPQGYQIKVANAGVLRYPAKPFRPQTAAERGDATAPLANYWSVDPGQYEFGMTLIGALESNGQNVTTATMELGAFAGNEVRGAAQAIPVDTLGTYQFFLTSYANTNGELLQFKLYDAVTGEVWNLTETMYFSADQHQGTVTDPVAFTLKSLGTAGSAFQPSFEVRPNPFTSETFFRFILPYTQDIALTIYDTRGREVSAVRTQATEGLNILRWSGIANSGQHLNPGVYLVRLQTDTGVVSKKVVLQR